jgi:IclR family transcriptional regulator, pca regulon regulatory protein
VQLSYIRIMSEHKFSIAKADMIEGVAKGMAVLESFDTQRQRLNATMASQKAGITRAAARRHLLTLAYLGYLETDGSYFWLAPKIMRFSGSYLSSARLPRVVQPTLNRLASLSGHSYSVVVLDEQEVVIVARSDIARVLAYGLHLGARLPAHATSTGHVLLSAKSKDEFTNWCKDKTLIRLTRFTLTSFNELKKRIRLIQKNDFDISCEEHELGVSALSVPLRDMQGQVVAAINVVLPSSEWSVQAIEREFLPLLQGAAQELRGVL